MLGYIAVYPRRTLVHNISQYTPIYSNILLFRPGISSGIYWNILEYTGDVSTGRIYRNISQYIPIFSNISGPYIAIYWLIFHISAVNLIVSILLTLWGRAAKPIHWKGGYWGGQIHTSRDYLCFRIRSRAPPLRRTSATG